MLACKTQVLPWPKKGTIVVDPMENMPVIKDLVTDMDDGFWPAYDSVRPYLARSEDKHDELFTWTDKLAPRNLDQLVAQRGLHQMRRLLLGLPEGAEGRPTFIGPQACIQLYKFYWDPRDVDHAWRMGRRRRRQSGRSDCDSHGNCVRVCPKDCRPLDGASRSSVET